MLRHLQIRHITFLHLPLRNRDTKRIEQRLIRRRRHRVDAVPQLLRRSLVTKIRQVIIHSLLNIQIRLRHRLKLLTRVHTFRNVVIHINKARVVEVIRVRCAVAVRFVDRCHCLAEYCGGVVAGEVGLDEVEGRQPVCFEAVHVLDGLAPDDEERDALEHEYEDDVEGEVQEGPDLLFDGAEVI